MSPQAKMAAPGEPACQADTGSDWYRHKCGRPVKEDGLCGIHLAAKRRRETNQAERKKQYIEQRAKGDRIAGLGRQLRDLGVLCHADTYRGHIILEDPAALIARIEQENNR